MMTTFELGGEHYLNIGRVHDMECSRAEEKILIEIVARLVLICHRTEESQKMSVRIGIPDLSNTIDSQWPLVWELRRKLTAMKMTKSQIRLRSVSLC